MADHAENENAKNKNNYKKKDVSFMFPLTFFPSTFMSIFILDG